MLHAFTEPTEPGPTNSENNLVCAVAAATNTLSANPTMIDLFAFISRNNNCF